MCTLSWHDTDGGYRLFFNRDERRERRPEIPPASRRSGTTRYIAPLDGDAGGTWIAVNEHGLSLCLLNGFPERGAANAGAERYTSRGELALGAIERATPAAVGESLRSADLERFRPFVLAAFSPSGAGLVASWSGRSLELEPQRPLEPPLISSSFCTEAVRESRRTVYDELCGRVQEGARTSAHLAFHASHRPARGPHSPCMHRPDATTVSFSAIDVDRDRIHFLYAPHSPCRGLPAEPAVVLTRAAGGASGR